MSANSLPNQIKDTRPCCAYSRVIVEGSIGKIDVSGMAAICFFRVPPGCKCPACGKHYEELGGA